MPFPAPLKNAALALALAAAATLLPAPWSAGEARADFRVCNGTQSLVGVAIGYRAEQGWMSEGWWRIPATTCRSVVEGELSSRFYYLYAEDSEGVSRWEGDIDLCIAENEFEIVGVQDCFTRGYQEMGFREYDTGSQASWMVQLTESPREEEQPAAAVPAAPIDPPPASPEGAGEPATEEPQAQ